MSKSSLRLEFAGQFPDTLHEAGLGDGEGDVQDGLRHQAAVLTVHQPHKPAAVGVGTRHHLHSTPVECLCTALQLHGNTLNWAAFLNSKANSVLSLERLPKFKVFPCTNSISDYCLSD